MHPSPYQDLIIHGEHLFRTGYVHEALQVFESVIAQEPHHVLALNNRGVILHGLGMYAEAEQIFLDVLCQDNNNAHAVFNLVAMYIDRYNINSAEDVLSKYISCLSIRDINEIIKHCITLPYGKPTDISPDTTITLNNAGHIMGSATVHLNI